MAYDETHQPIYIRGRNSEAVNRSPTQHTKDLTARGLIDKEEVQYSDESVDEITMSYLQDIYQAAKSGKSEKKSKQSKKSEKKSKQKKKTPEKKSKKSMKSKTQKSGKPKTNKPDKHNIGLDFIDQSLFKSFDDVAGADIVTSTGGSVFAVDYDAQFNDINFISLAASQNLIDEVSCDTSTNHGATVKITFKDDILPELISKMFPLNAFLVVDGIIFGSCNLESTNDNQGDHDGFLTVTNAMLSEQEVTVYGEVATVNHFFEKLAVTYDTVERRNLAAPTNSTSRTITEPKDAPIFLTSTLGLECMSFIKFAKLDWDFWEASYDVAIDLGWELKASMETSVKFQVKNELANYEKAFLEEWKYPLAGLPIAPAIQKVLKIFLPKSVKGDISVGLYLRAPILFKLTAEQEIELDLLSYDSSLSTGEKNLKVTLSSDASPTFDWTKNESPSFTNELKTVSDKELESLKINEIEFSGFARFLPQISFDIQYPP